MRFSPDHMHRVSQIWPLGLLWVDSASSETAMSLFLALPYFLVPQDIPGSACVFPLLSFELITSPRCPGSFFKSTSHHHLLTHLLLMNTWPVSSFTTTNNDAVNIP